ncbi:hypothetical protein [Fulvimarina sp. MAC8]|uniref:hypothetical protein n=1 Tax=Fulvimarina sp. MAC8 TaxID=3162874 RepID=UPI0032EB7FA4
MVLADADGLIFLPQEFAEQIIEDADDLAQFEAKIGSELPFGSSRADVFGNNPCFAHIRPRWTTEA